MSINAVTVMDENDQEIKSPMKRVGSTRKILIFNNIRQQLNEQLRCLDIRVESQVSLIQELQEFFRRRGELELDYSKSLEKFSRNILLRHKEQKQKRDQWPIFSTFTCWQYLINQTQALSRDHATLAEIYSVSIVSSLQTTIDDLQRLYKKCRGLAYEIHEEIFRVLQELHTTMKTYQRYEAECKTAELKLNTAENQRIKLEQTIHKEKLERSKKYRLTEKEVLKRNTKYTDARLKSLRAKNEYQLCLEAANTTIQKFFVEDLSDLIDCMDLGFSSMISRAILMHVSADQGRSRALLKHCDSLTRLINSIDSRADKQKFLEMYHAAFMIPKRLDFQGPSEDETQIDHDIRKVLFMDMEQRLQMLDQRLRNLRTETDEIWKTLETAEVKLLEHFNNKDCDLSDVFTENKHNAFKQQQQQSTTISTKLQADKQEIEDFYILKIREYIKGTSRIARLDAKAELLRSNLSKDDTYRPNLGKKPVVSKRKRIGRVNTSGQPRLFGGSLEEYLELTGEEVPLILRSCIRVINLFGLHHQGIFRVSGSQVEIANFREVFERGEDPLAETNDASDINSVAGVLKLYLRELREPLFPIIYFDYFASIAELRHKNDQVLGIKKFLHSLPRPVLVVIRYLFAFLNHLSEYSDENMMDAYNLAICFGPTLMPAPEDKDQVQYQNQVNELIKTMIMYHDELFPKDMGGLEYEKYISNENFIDMDVGDSPTEGFNEDPDADINPSEEEPETLEAMVLFDFNARSSREMTLKKGDSVILIKQISNDWWQGILNGKEGLIPDKYISLKIRDEDRDKVSLDQSHIKDSSCRLNERDKHDAQSVGSGSLGGSIGGGIGIGVGGSGGGASRGSNAGLGDTGSCISYHFDLDAGGGSGVGGSACNLEEDPNESIVTRDSIGGDSRSQDEYSITTDMTQTESGKDLDVSFVLSNRSANSLFKVNDLNTSNNDDDNDSNERVGGGSGGGGGGGGREDGDGNGGGGNEVGHHTTKQLPSAGIKKKDEFIYHDEPHSFESAMEFQKAYDTSKLDLFETTV